MPTDQDPEEFIEEDEQDEIARRSIFSAGWFRALLVLTVLAIVVVVSLPYLLNWLEPTPGPPSRPQVKVTEQAPPPRGTPPPTSAPSKQLKNENFPVTVSRISRGGSAPAAPAAPANPGGSGGQNQLYITGSTTDAVNAALKGKGTAQAVKGGLVVNPSYDLETAMSLSSALKKEGFKVVIRRAKAAPATAPPPSNGAGGTIYHVVRVGGYPDRAKALQVRGELEAKGHRGFLAQGAAR